MSRESAAPNCRACKAVLEHTFVDLGPSPISNAFRRPQDRGEPEPFFPLHAYVCDRCWLVQLPSIHRPEALFTADYPYFSSYSESWLDHARHFADQTIERFGIRQGDLVVEVASNDGYLLQFFKQCGIDVLGVDPAANVADAAQRKYGVRTLVRFFGLNTARELKADGVSPRLMIANNVLAHVPDINDFISGFSCLLNSDGISTFEFPHVLNLIRYNQFDTIYHEHYSYLSLGSVERILGRHGLRIFDLENLATHGGSLRLYVCHSHAAYDEQPNVEALRIREREAGLEDIATYRDFRNKVHHTKRQLLCFLINAKETGKSAVGYGAPAKGNTLLNYCGIRTDFLEYTVDRNPHKQGLLLPGTAIPVCSPDRIRETRPDYILILPWNLQDEIIESLQDIRSWGGKFVVPIPETRILT